MLLPGKHTRLENDLAEKPKKRAAEGLKIQFRQRIRRCPAEAAAT
jgi:hypothetical protein